MNYLLRVIFHVFVLKMISIQMVSSFGWTDTEGYKCECIEYEKMNFGSKNTLYKGIMKKKEARGIVVETPVYVKYINSTKAFGREVDAYNLLSGLNITPKMHNYDRKLQRVVLEDAGECLIDKIPKTDSYPQFPLSYILDILELLLNILKKLVEIGIIHTDIKPDNLIASDDLKTFLLIDFEDCILNYTTTPDAYKKGFHGTDKYSSLNSQTGGVMSPKDDQMSASNSALYLYQRDKYPLNGLDAKEMTPIKSNFEKMMPRIREEDKDFFRHLFRIVNPSVENDIERMKARIHQKMKEHRPQPYSTIVDPPAKNRRPARL